MDTKELLLMFIIINTFTIIVVLNRILKELKNK